MTRDRAVTKGERKKSQRMTEIGKKEDTKEERIKERKEEEGRKEARKGRPRRRCNLLECLSFF